MPQFDVLTFFVQVFWSVMFGCFTYFFCLRFPIKNTSQVLKVRKRLATLKALSQKKNFNTKVCL